MQNRNGQEEALFRLAISQALHEARQGGIGKSGAEAALVRLVDRLLERAVAYRASDLHIEPGEQGVRLRYRCDGLLREDTQLLPAELAPLISSRLKVMAGMDIAKRQLPQDGHIRYESGTRRIDIRVSSLPAADGEVLVLRLMNLEERPLALEELGFSAENLKLFRKVIRRPSGLLLLCGPMNSGKTTTLYAAMAELNAPEISLVSLEDPIERRLPGVSQVQVNEKTGLTYVAGLRAILRQDAQKVLLGEIRDGQTAQMAVRIALTGHLVMTTLHTEDATAAVLRLLEMGVPPYLLAATLTGVVAQRLVRRVCPTCQQRHEVKAGSEEAALLGQMWQPGLQLRHGCGCEACGETGYRGRMALHELLQVTPALREAILSRADREALRRQAEADGLRSLWQDGADKVLAGETTLSEVRRVIYG